MRQRRNRKQLGAFAVCFVLFFLGATIAVLAADENKASSKAISEEEKRVAMEKTLKEMSAKESSSTAKEEIGQESSSQEGEKTSGGENGIEKKKKSEADKIKEKEFFMQMTDVFWKISEEVITVEIIGPRREEVPSGKILFEREGLVARWKPGTQMIMKRKKRNSLDSPWASEIFFKENSAKTKALGAPAPYYALAEVEVHFTEPVSCDIIKGRQSLRLEFRPLKKRKPKVVEEEPKEKEITLAEAAPTSPGQMLGSTYQAKAKYETYVLGQSRSLELLDSFQRERAPQKGLFDGTMGLPQDMGEVFKEAYPSFGSLDYWKKYVQAVFDQTAGFSSDYDGSFGAWGGFRADNPAMTWTPDLAVRYLRPGVITPSLGYQIRRQCPVSRLLHFGDGYQNQTISFGAGYTPEKPYAVFSQNDVSLFRSKNLNQNDDGSFTKDGNKGIRMTNALGLNYRLTRKLIWKIEGGLERTRSNDSENGRSRTQMGFLGTDFGYSLTAKLALGLGYSYRHTFKDTSQPSGPTTTWVKSTKGKNLQAPSIGFNYEPLKRLTLDGSITPAIIDGQYLKFGGATSIKYKFLKADDIFLSYSNAVAQDDTAQLTGRNLSGGIGSAGGASLSRDEVSTITFNHWLTTRTTPNTKLSLSLSYHRGIPLHSLSSDIGNLQDGLSFTASLRRRLRGGRLWIEISYRFENFRSRALSEDATQDSSVKEHSVFFAITNYFGQKGG